MVTALLSDLSRLLPPGHVSVDPEELSRVSGDALAAYRAYQRIGGVEAAPAALVSPTCVEDTAAVASYASQRGIPLVPRGGGTGVMGGAVPVEGAIVVELRGLDTVHDIDREGRRVTVGAGAILEDVEGALSRRGLLLGHDPWSRPIATVGGAISTNGMGYLAGKYGSMGEQVLGLQAVLGNGDVIETPGVPKVAGPDVDSLFIGAEGAMGIITRATLAAHPQPEERRLCAYRFNSFMAGYGAVQEMHAIGLRPAMIDFDEEFSRETPGQPEESETTLYVSFEGYREEAAAQRERGHRICVASGGELLPAQEAEVFWRERHSSAERYKREVLLHGHSARRRRRPWRMDYLHVSIPASQVPAYHDYCRRLLAQRGIPVREWSLWGRPEYFSLLISDPSPADRPDAALMGRAVDDILTAAQDMGGSMEYCHGVGLKLTHLMGRDRGDTGLEALRRVKQALDPQRILNPGNLDL